MLNGLMKYLFMYTKEISKNNLGLDFTKVSAMERYN